MKQTPQSYQQLVKQLMPRTNCAKNCLMAFLFGGFICVLGQAAHDLPQYFGLPEKSCAAISSVFLIFLASLLTALNVFDNIGKIAGAGTLVPITGFANSVVSAGMEFKSEGLIFGTGGKIFNVAGPVVVYGTVFSVLYGVIILIFGI